MDETVQISEVEIHTSLQGGEAGQIIYFNDRAKKMGSHWVPFDPNRGGDKIITWLSDQIDGAANGCTLAETQAAVSRAMTTWNNVKGATIPLVEWPDYGMDWGYVQSLMDFGGFPGWYADITQAGWLPREFFTAWFGEEESEYILGVTFTLIWIDSETGLPTDMDNNRKQDVAFREVYYNNFFTWAIDLEGWSQKIDVESIVLHENGHGLSLGHFGKLTRTPNGKLHWSPEAVMNAGYVYPQRELSGTDTAAFYSIWASWPNN
ncbi:MAG TPA: hypothetical protein P5186_02130 [Candidatus Paceibacterota bacterium]|nr:hypothetical protein [Verrucomicrobiota bacterium]HRY46820.1 hypothetical protein [Candidatus Paceibacterota bacterium]